MPYEELTDLPDSVRDNLPKHAQEIYRAAYNSAEEQYDEEDRRHRVPGAPSSKSTRRTKKVSGSRRRIKTLFPTVVQESMKLADAAKATTLLN